MHQLIRVTASIFALTTMLSACGTKGPLTLPPPPSVPQAAVTSQPAQPSPPAAPATDAATATGQH